MHARFLAISCRDYGKDSGKDDDREGENRSAQTTRICGDRLRNLAVEAYVACVHFGYHCANTGLNVERGLDACAYVRRPRWVGARTSGGSDS